ncbi:MAG: glycosyltransferase family 4 protein [Rhizonema sp. PD38]|nr:glycosyltransferase family 4 protein [Rhizonema sp. PD38]
MYKSTDSQKQIIKVLMLGASLDIQGGITSVEKLILENVPPEIQIHHVGTFAPGSLLQNAIVFLKAIKTLVWKLLRGEVDLVHIHFSERGSTLRKLIIVLIILAFRQPLILHSHGATYQEFFAGIPRLAQIIISLLFSKCTKFIALSENWRNYFIETLQLDENQTTVLYNPVNLPLNIPQRRDKQQVKFVFLGRIGKRGGALDAAKSIISFPKQDKGAFDLIKAFAALPESDRNCAELVLAGNGDLEMAQQLIQELAVEEKVTLCAWLIPVQRDALLAAADAFILPSYNEGLPMSMLEAMAWGLPVIVTPVGGIPEVINHNQNGLLVQPGNQEQLVQAMQNLIRDEESRIALGTAARRRVECFDVKNYITSLAALYASVVRQEACEEKTLILSD